MKYVYFLALPYDRKNMLIYRVARQPSLTTGNTLSYTLIHPRYIFGSCPEVTQLLLPDFKRGSEKRFSNDSEKEVQK
jgi:hypothetical protein